MPLVTRPMLVNVDQSGVRREIATISVDSTSDGGRVLVGVTDPAFSGVIAKPQYFLKDFGTGVFSLASSYGGDRPVLEGELSADGAKILFVSAASNLVNNDTNGAPDLFVNASVFRTNVRVNTSSSGEQDNGGALVGGADLAEGGRYVAFTSLGSNLAPGDGNGRFDVFRKDLQTGETVLVSTAATGGSSNGVSVGPAISADGRIVAFRSDAANLPQPDPNGGPQVYWKDTATGEIRRVSTAEGGATPPGSTLNVDLSADGRFVAFSTNAALTPGDTNGQYDIYLRDMATGQLQRVSQFANGDPTPGNAAAPTISSGGQFVAFEANRQIYVKDVRSGELTLVTSGRDGSAGNGPSYGAQFSGDFLTFISQAPNLASVSGINAYIVGVGAPVTTAPEAPGRVLVSDSYGDWLIGASGADTIYAGGGPDSLTGGGGRDVFVFREVPFNAGRITDFSVGQDKLDISALFRASGYAGTDPVADAYLRFESDGSGGTQVIYDTDGAASGNTLGFIVTRLNGVAPAGLKASDILGSDAPDAPPPEGGEGRVITSARDGDILVGGQGNDTLNAGQGRDVLTGNGGGDAFVFKALPWNAGRITDFALGADRLDLSAIFQASGYAGADPVADGRMRFESDAVGGTRVYFDNDAPGSGDWPFLITTLDGISPVGLTWGQLSRGAAAPPAPAPGGNGSVLTWSRQGDTLVGGAGADTLNGSQGPDQLTGGAGGDLFAWAQTPWRAGHVTDFTPGADKLDLSLLFDASDYAGTDPVRDGRLEFRGDGLGNTQVYFDRDAPRVGDWPFLITTLDKVRPDQIGSGDWLFQ
ncbi:type I secretion C-terminal target domain-containing protein [Phenylobacterium sp.]|uniref:type I secretion C-terminal target domain-containing protein n=1 Tax=Phenylobacterium sp. TaxID=1871053 RepID=UPI00286E383F|nr:type I secretion C-terminal target domain-containing protein [Phenylobacterium sp.]